MKPSSTSGPSDEGFEDEITFKELIFSLAGIITWIKGHILKLSIFIFIGLSVSLFWAFKQAPTYVAELTFMLNDDNNPQVSGLSGLLGQFGLPVPSGKYNVDKLLEIAKSRRLMDSTLLSSANINGRTDLLANHLMEAFDLTSKWSERDERFKDFLFNKNRPREDSRLDQFALKSLSSMIAGASQDRSNALLTTDYGKTDYIMSLVMKSPSEELSISFVNELYNQVSKFYVDKAVEKNKSIYNIIRQKKDSISALINSTAYDIADLKDKESGTFRNTNKVKVKLLESQLLRLQAASEEIVKNFERAQFVLETNTPLIQILDWPLSPLSPQKPSVVKYGLFGAFLGVLLFLVVIFLGQVIRVAQYNSL